MGKNFSNYALLFADLAAIVAGFRIAYWVRFDFLSFFPSESIPTFGPYWAAILLALGIWILLFRGLQMDRFYEGVELPLAISRLIAAVMLLVVCLLAGSYLAKIYYSRLLLAVLSILLVFLLLATRLAYQASLKWLRRYGVGLRRVVIVGKSELARELADRIKQHQELHYELVGFLFPGTSRTQNEGQSATFGASEDIAGELVNKKVDELIFAIPIRRDSEILEFIARCQKLGIEVKVIPEYYELHASQLKSFSIDGIPIFELRETSIEPAYRIVKSLMDYSVATLLLVLFCPIIILISIVLYFVSKGRVIRREVRVGLGGRQFVMYRFNMSVAESPLPRLEGACAVRFCRFLHRYSFSELPQLWNVLRGEMSMVGPRPETPERVRHYSAWHRRRLHLKPGITGLAQVKGLRGFDSSDEKTKHDLEYAANFSPFLDLTLALATPGTLLRRRKAVALRTPSTALPSDRTLHPRST